MSNELTMDLIEPFKRGYLLTPPQGMLKRTWQKKYYALYRANNFGIERVEIFDSEDQYLRHYSPNKIIPLNDCIKVVQAPQKHQHNVFEVICKNQIYQFSAETTQELSEWITSLQTVAFGQQRRESYPLLSIPTVRESFGNEELEQEENLIYSSMSSPELYIVQIIETEASRRCGLRGTYQLSVTSLNISLSLFSPSSTKPSKVLHTWPYRHIRRFSRTKETFSFEAGRKCSSGEGLISFETKEGNAIFQSVGMYLKSFKKQDPLQSSQKNVSFAMAHENDTTKSSQSLRNCSYKDSPASLMTSSKFNKNSDDNLTKAPLNPIDSLYENTMLGQNKLRPPIIKPPRKPKIGSTSHMFSSSVDSVPSTMEGLSPEPSPSANDEFHPPVFKPQIKFTDPAKEPTDVVYDTPEEQMGNAWKTFALEKDNIHMENIPEDVAALYASVDVTMLSSKPSHLKRHVSVPEVSGTPDSSLRQISLFSQCPRNSDGSYDHLFQFHTPNKNSSNPEHIYKKLQLPDNDDSDPLYSSVLETETPPTKLESEPCHVPSDDTNSTPELKHIIQNEEVYTVVQKPNKNLIPVD